MRTESNFFLFVLAQSITSSVIAGVTLDGSLGAPGALTGPNYNITAELGKTVGSNLFHSFGVFNIGNGESANFSGPGSIAHIIGRVTGGSASTIDGRLSSSIPGASLYLINPNGLIFGPNASLDVSGSFFASTASQVLLGDGGVFDASTPPNSILTIAPPAAFGFIAQNPAPIQVNGAQLAVADGQQIGLFGGNLTFDQGAQVIAPGGKITLVSGASPGEALLDGTQNFSSGGDINLRGFSEINATAADFSGGGGVIVIRSGRLTLDASRLEAISAEQPGGNIDIGVGQDVVLASGAEITTDTVGAGDGGSVSISAGHAITLSGRGADGGWTAIRTNTAGSGKAGQVTLHAPNITLDEGLLQSLTIGQQSATASGNAGAISIDTDVLSLSNGGQLDSGVRSNSTGSAGSVQITARQSVTLTGVSADGHASAIYTSTTGEGKGGDIQVRAPRLEMTGGAEISATTAGSGNGGSIQLDIASMTVLGGSQIAANATASGKGGVIGIVATDSLTISGQDAQGGYSAIRANTNGSGDGGSISLVSGMLLVDGGLIQALSYGDRAASGQSGKAGNISVNATRLNLVNGGQLDSGSRDRSNGAGGNIEVHAEDILISGVHSAGHGSAIFANTLGEGAGGNIWLDAARIRIENSALISASSNDVGSAGYIQIDTDSLDIQGGGRITASANGSGAGGDIKITAKGAVTVAGEWVDEETSAILAQTFGPGNAGNVNINAASLALLDGGKISSSSRDTEGGNGGNIHITARDSISVSGESLAGAASGIFADTTGRGMGGNIILRAPDILVSEAGTVQASTYASGPGGSITFEANRLNILNGGEIISDTMGSGRGGSVDVKASESIVLSGRNKWDYRSLIRANAGATGDGGVINLTSPEIKLDDAAIQVTSWNALGSELINGTAGSVNIRATDLALANGATIDSSSRFSSTGDGGLISIQATSMHMTGPLTAINALTEGSGAGGVIRLQAQEITLDDYAQIKAETSGSGAGGHIQIESETLNLLAGSAIEANTEGSGNGGSISITASQALRLASPADTYVLSGIRASTYGSGDGGYIKLISPSIVMDNGLVQARTQGALSGGAANGAAGNITIETRQISLENGAQIDTSSRDGSNGMGGSVLIEASDSISITGRVSTYPTAIFSNTFGSGDGGYLYLVTPNLIVGDHALIQAATVGSGMGGFIRIEADKISVSGEASISAAAYGTGAGGYISLVSSAINMDGGYVQALTSGTLPGGEANGAAGYIVIETGSISLKNGAQIDTGSRGGSNGGGGGIIVEAKDGISVMGEGADFPSAIFSNTLGSGDGGFIHLITPSLSVGDHAYIQAATTESGAGGYINIEADKISVTNGGIISAATFGSGAGGYIDILARESVTLSGGGAISAQTEGYGDGGYIFIDSPILKLDNAKITTDSKGEGVGGYINIHAEQDVTMKNQSSIESRSSSMGDAGAIFIDTGIFTADNSLLTTAATHAGGGNIELLATTVRLKNHSAITATVGGGFGDGGNVTVTAQGFAAVEDSDLTARANQGHGGRITINAEAFLRTADVDLDASSNVLGNEGVVEVNAPNLDLTGSLVVLPTNFLDASALLNDPCAALRASEESSFVVRGKGGLPFQPDGLFPGPLMLKSPIQPNGAALPPRANRPGSNINLSPDCQKLAWKEHLS
ncbi:MAG: filamentous hemagglutinin N-terminal domain-containing protein [Sulfuricellaceae bacterium]|nr:filamentous hemagglutinin N-terminal domain-containing protein [Sulfuricellaceae bacterium]